MNRHVIGAFATFLLLPGAIVAPAGAAAQTTVHNDEHLGRSRPEAWAMTYAGAATLLTPVGTPPALAPWHWGVAADLGHIPRLSARQQRVGLGGVKEEDLDKTEIFGRLRLLLGLPAGFVAELGYTPPISIGGAQPLDLFAVALGRTLFAADRFAVSLQAIGQHGRVHGDITCPARIAGAGPALNPFGCEAPSDDHATFDYYGVTLASEWRLRTWRAHASVGAVRSEFAVNVDALTFGVRDGSRLVARGLLPMATLGASRDLSPRWTIGGELLYVPLGVQREPHGPTENDALASLRVELLHRFD